MKRLNDKGITLIALVITIIVLLILAGVSIATLTGDNGILTRTSDADVETRAASVEERKNVWKTEKQTDNYVGENTAQTLEELLDDLDNMFHLEHIIVCVSASSSENISNLMSDLGMYPHIELKMVPSLYLLGKTEFLLSYLGMDEKNTVVIKASRFYDAYNTLKRGRCPSDKLFTISGNAIKNPMVIQSKIGVLLKDIIKELIEFKEKDFLFIAGGLMQGKIIDIDNFVITHSLDSILIMKKEEAKKSLSCLKCGACHDICPKGLYPNLFSDPVYFEQKKNICLKCGLCSYICPVYINFNKYWKGENNE